MNNWWIIFDNIHQINTKFGIRSEEFDKWLITYEQVNYFNIRIIFVKLFILRINRRDIIHAIEIEEIITYELSSKRKNIDR
jgi:hypothetical protein